MAAAIPRKARFVPTPIGLSGRARDTGSTVIAAVVTARPAASETAGHCGVPAIILDPLER
jgi:hypothetical protein